MAKATSTGVDVCDVGTMFFYNVDMFEEAGYAQEDMPLTKEDHVDLG